MIVKKENYILRPWRESDCNSLAYYANNISIWNNLRDSFPHPYTSDDADAFIKMASVEPYSQFAIEVSGRAVAGLFGKMISNDLMQRSDTGLENLFKGWVLYQMLYLN